jgi:hypothetical protein
MPHQTIVTDKPALVLVVILSLLALALTLLAPGFQLENGLVYGGF